MAEEFVLSINVDADLSKFRTSLRQELAAVQQQGATIPVAAVTGAAGTSVVPPGGAGVSPAASVTANTVAQQSTQAVANAMARANLYSSAGGVMLPGGQMVPSGFAPAGMPGGPIMPPQPQPGPGQPGQPTPGYPGYGRGLGRYLGAAYGFRAATELISNEVEYGRDVRLAEGDPAALIQADIQHRRRFAGAFGEPGRLGLAINEFLTHDEEDVTGTLRAAGRQDSATAQMRRSEGLLESFRAIGEHARAGTAVDQRRADIQNEYLASVRKITEEQTAAETKAREPFLGQRATIERETQEQLNDVMSSTQGGRQAIESARAEVYRRADERLANVNQSENDVVANIRRQHQTAKENAAASQARQLADIDRSGGWRSRLYRAETERFQGLAGGLNPRAAERIFSGAADELEIEREGYESGPEAASALMSRQMAASAAREAGWGRTDALSAFVNRGATGASRLRTMGRPFAASIAQQLTQMGAEIFQARQAGEDPSSITQRGVQGMAESFVGMARDFGHDQRQVTAQNRLLQKELERDPLAARLEAVRADTQEQVIGFSNRPWGFRQLLQGAARLGGAMREQLLRRDDDDARQLRIQSLDNRREHFDLLAERRPYSAQATNIQRQTEEDVAEMRQSRRFSTEEIRKRVELGVSEEKSFEAQLRRRQGAGMGMEVPAGAFAPGVGGSDTTEPITRGLDAVRVAIEKLSSILTGN